VINNNQDYDRIIVNSILNFLTASNACGSLAGITTISPLLARRDFPDIIISTLPSRIKTKASKGAECSLKLCAPSKANSVNVPPFY